MEALIVNKLLNFWHKTWFSRKFSKNVPLFVFGPWKTRNTHGNFRKHLQSTIWWTFDRKLDLEPNLLKISFVFVRPWTTIKTNGDFRKHLQSTIWLTFDKNTSFASNFRKKLICFCSVLNNYKNKRALSEARTVNNLVNVWQNTWFWKTFRTKYD